MTETAPVTETKKKINLPTQPSEPTKDVPSSLIIFGLPKCGKTTKFAELPNALNIDIERGTDFIKMMKIQPPAGLGPVGVFAWLREAAKEVKDAGNPYDFVIVETISYLDELAEWKGTWDYMNSIQGKSFNRVDGQKGGAFLAFDHPEYQSVHTLADGAGYRWSRQAMTSIFDACKGLGKVCTIFSCHTADKSIVTRQTNTEVKTMDLSLTGKVKQILSRDVDAIGYVWNKDGVLHISFKGDESKLGGMRGNNHIQGYEGPLDWDMIFKLNK